MHHHRQHLPRLAWSSMADLVSFSSLTHRLPCFRFRLTHSLSLSFVRFSVTSHSLFIPSRYSFFNCCYCFEFGLCLFLRFMVHHHCSFLIVLLRILFHHRFSVKWTEERERHEREMLLFLLFNNKTNKKRSSGQRERKTCYRESITMRATRWTSGQNTNINEISTGSKKWNGHERATQ